MNKVLIANDNNCIYIKPCGHITANLSLPIRESLMKKISSFSCKLHIIIDMCCAEYMDSTFMGLLISINKAMIDKQQQLEILNLSETCTKLIKSMGLDKFLNISARELPKSLDYQEFDGDLDIAEIDETKIILEAHQNLSAISEDNQKKFSVLQTILQDKINSEENKSK